MQNIDLLALSRYKDMLEAQRNGVSWAQYFSRGTVPIQQVRNFESAWFLLLQEYTERNGNAGHEIEYDEVTGEVFSDNIKWCFLHKFNPFEKCYFGGWGFPRLVRSTEALQISPFLQIRGAWYKLEIIAC